MSPSKQNIKAIDQWQRENTDLIRIRVRKDSGIKKAIDEAAKLRGEKPTKYIVRAITKQLHEDGIEINAEPEDDE